MAKCFSHHSVLTVALVVVAFAACGQLGQQSGPTLAEVDRSGAEAAYQAGNAHFAEGDYNAAVDAYTDAISRDASRADAYNNRALAYIQLRLYDLALGDVQQAISLSREDPEILFNLGNVQLLRGFYPQARDAFERVLEMRPSDLEAKNNLAVAYTRLEEHDTAERLLSEVLEVEPENVDAISNLGTVYDAGGDTNRALSMYRRALDIDPEHFRTLRNLGFLEVREGMTDEAIDHLQRYLALVPEGVNVRRVEGTLDTLRNQ